jgi:hypothetical protein
MNSPALGQVQRGVKVLYMGLAMHSARAIGARGELWLLGVTHKEATPLSRSIVAVCTAPNCIQDYCRHKHIVFIKQ